MLDSTPGDARSHGQRLPPPHPPLGSPHLARLTDLWARWRDRPEVAVVALLVLALGAGTYWYRAGMAGAADEGAAQTAATARRAAVSEASGPMASAGSAPAGAGAEAVVHVAGAVVRPGVYTLAAGSRVADAIEAGGGPAPEADLDRLNLAAKVVDGQRVLVTRRGEPAPPDEGTTGGGDPASGVGSGERLNLNTATKAQLEALPGIGPSMAQAILDQRQRRGGFRSVRDLLDVRGIGDARFAELRDLVSV